MHYPTDYPVLFRVHQVRSVVAVVTLLFLLQQISFAATPFIQSPSPQTGPAPSVPAQVISAQTVFLSNAGADNNFPIDSTEAYNNIYAALQSWGHYQLVPSPEQADVIFVLRDIAPTTIYDVYHGRPYSYVSPAYRLTIVDPHTQVTLWTITSPVNLAGNKKAVATWKQLSVTNLVSRLKVLDGIPLSSTETADLTLTPKHHFGRNATIIVVAVVAAGVAGGLILHHEFENSVANDKASQDAFCAAHNIPLSECAGG